MTETPADELNWPKQGEKLFRDDFLDWQHTGYAGGEPRDISQWNRYVEGYRTAADLVVAGVVGQAPRGQFDLVLHPVVFLYRHHFELALKTVVLLGRRYFDEKDDVPIGHGLMGLWREARRLLEKRWPDRDREVDDTVARLLGELDGFDPKGTAFRYPDTKDGQTSFPGGVAANVRHFAEVAGRVGNYLMSCITGLWCELDLKETFLSDMRSMFGDEVW
ncbi:MAG: hypothetical protein IMZ44_13270 [Planctomycetes bacterium]|nr:hypothetical protein [Planctomycetota bacterium]